MTGPTQTIAGVDVGKRICHICLITPAGDRDLTAPRDQVAATLLQHLATDTATIALELTGNLALPILAELESTPHHLLIAHHTDSAALRQLLRSRRKTDRLDARLLARLAQLWLHPDTRPLTGAQLTPWHQIRPAILGRAHARHLQALTRDRARIRQRLSYADTPHRRQHLTAQLHLLTAQIAEAERLLLHHASPAAALLATLPGATPRLAAILDAAIGDISRFSHADHLVSYLGLTPPHRPQSGSITRRPTRRRGLDLIHTELHMWALRVAAHPQRHGPCGQTYQRIAARLSPTAGLWAAKRQLVRIAYGVLRTGTPHRQQLPRFSPKGPAFDLGVGVDGSRARGLAPADGPGSAARVSPRCRPA